MPNLQPPTIETARLMLRAFRPTDRDALARANYIPTLNVYRLHEAR